MLILRRREGESILVGNVEIEVVEISRSRVKLGIRAPSSISVMRKEALTIAQENRLASAIMADRGVEVVDELLQYLQRSGTQPEPGSQAQRIGRVADM